jgi:hypothetical protein
VVQSICGRCSSGREATLSIASAESSQPIRADIGGPRTLRECGKARESCCGWEVCGWKRVWLANLAPRNWREIGAVVARVGCASFVRDIKNAVPPFLHPRTRPLLLMSSTRCVQEMVPAPDIQSMVTLAPVQGMRGLTCEAQKPSSARAVGNRRCDDCRHADRIASFLAAWVRRVLGGCRTVTFTHWLGVNPQPRPLGSDRAQAGPNNRMRA